MTTFKITDNAECRNILATASLNADLDETMVQTGEYHGDFISIHYSEMTEEELVADDFENHILFIEVEHDFDDLEEVIDECDDTYSLADIDSPSEAEEFARQIKKVSDGLLSISGNGFAALVRAKVDEDVAEDMTYEDALLTEKLLVPIFEQMRDLLREAIPRDRAVTSTKRIRLNGNSLTITITEEVAMLGLGRGDLVEVTLKRV